VFTAQFLVSGQCRRSLCRWVWGRKAVQNSIYQLQANPTKPARNPPRKGCLIRLLSKTGGCAWDGADADEAPLFPGTVRSRAGFRHPQRGSSIVRHFLACNQPFCSQQPGIQHTQLISGSFPAPSPGALQRTTEPPCSSQRHLVVPQSPS